MKATIRLLPLLLVVLFFSGCLISEKEQTAGGEDFPNSLGPVLSDNLNQHKGWNLLDSVPRQLPGQDVHIPTAPPGTEAGVGVPLAKLASPDEAPLNIMPKSLMKISAAAQDTLSLKDTTIYQRLGDTIFAFSQKISPPDTNYNYSTIRCDTMVVFAQDTIEANHRIIIGFGSVYNLITRNRVSSYAIDDADGDGMVHPMPDKTNRAQYRQILYKPLFNRLTTITIDAGPDIEFGKDGNEASKDDKIVSSSTLVTTTAGDTVEFVEWTDYDGDGVVHPNSETKKNQIVMLDLKINLLFKTRVFTRLILDAGPDLDFDKERDNLALSITTTILNGNLDTLEYSAIERPDGKGIPMHESYSGSIEVDIVHLKKPLLKIPERIETRTRMVVFPSDSTKNYPIKFSEVKSWQNGRRLVSTIIGPGADNAFHVGDTVTVSIKNYPIWPKNVAERSVTFKAGLGENPVKDDDNVMYSFVVAEARARGDMARLSFSFMPGEPLRDGEEPESGILELKAEYRDDTWASITGELTSGKITVTFITRKGKKGEAVLNLDGEVME